MKDICIYCMGEYGLETYFKLKEMGIKVSCFGDRDMTKCGYVLDNIFCISYEDVLKLDKKKTAIVVAIKNPQQLIEQFRGLGFNYVYDKNEILPAISSMVNRKENMPLMDLELIEMFKTSLTRSLYENEYDEFDNADMQQIIIDLSRRRG